MNSTATPLKFEWKMYVPPELPPDTSGLPGAAPPKEQKKTAPRLEVRRRAPSDVDGEAAARVSDRTISTLPVGWGNLHLILTSGRR